MDQTIKQIRSFNRFYTSHIGLLNQHFLESSYSLTEVRILYEVGEHKTLTAQDLCNYLHLDKGYVSRILKAFFKKEIILKIQSQEDARSYSIELTEKGKELLFQLQAKSDGEMNQFAQKLGSDEKNMLINSMKTIQNLLAVDFDKKTLAKNVTFREGLKPGDIGFLIHLHGMLYAKESGYSLQFEGYVAKTFYDFLATYSKDNDRVWMAEYNQEIVGCIAIVHHSDKEAQLRWFLTHPTFRGTGIGKKLLNMAMDYCKEKKYSNVYLLTTSLQDKAIEMYKKVGFVQTESTESSDWGRKLYEERFDLTL